MTLRLSLHAQERIAQRNLSPATLAAALDGRRYEMPDGRLIHIGPGRVAVVVDPTTQTVVTAYRLLKKSLKRNFSR